jgi:hypothetical protein
MENYLDIFILCQYMAMFGNDKNSKNSISIFSCAKCNYNTSKKCNFEQHLLTLKHETAMFGNEKTSKNSTPKYACNYCDKTYKDYSGLWKHKQKCKQPISEDNTTELIKFLMKENTEFKQLLIEQNKQLAEIGVKGIDNAGHNHVNSHNKTFNLQFFLNETCKDAMNIMDFVSQLQVNVKDVEETGRLGFTEGISNIFINGLKQMNVSDRPIHCSDSKRETLYIKNNNEWNKEGEDKSILTNAIKHVAHKNMKQISIWAKEHPNYNNPSSKENDKYLQIVSESVPGLTNEETNKKYNKIIKNIVKETIIDK